MNRNSFFQQEVVLVVSRCRSFRNPSVPAVKWSANDEVIFSEVALSYTVSLSLHLLTPDDVEEQKDFPPNREFLCSLDDVLVSTETGFCSGI